MLNKNFRRHCLSVKPITYKLTVLHRQAAELTERMQICKKICRKKKRKKDFIRVWS